MSCIQSSASAAMAAGSQCFLIPHVAIVMNEGTEDVVLVERVNEKSSPFQAKSRVVDLLTRLGLWTSWPY